MKRKTKKRKREKTKVIPYDQNWTLQRAKNYLAKRIWKKFGNWMIGQTCPMIKQGNKQVLGVYEWDVTRFADMILEGKPTYFD